MTFLGAKDEWTGWQKMNDPVLHIQLRDWADIAVIAPLSAHTMAKIANGLCDETLTCVLRAWDFGYSIRKGKPLLLAPAMNTAMWEHPLTRSQLATIQGFWNVGHGRDGDYDGDYDGDGDCLIKIAEPQVKTLACGEVGNGALASVDCIVQMSHELLSSSLQTLTRDKK
jgi:phosphopantothenoylcysteine synthetase/decarboxylase